MIKVLIVVSGLVMFVPDPGRDPRGMTALLLETRFAHSSMTPHVPALRQQIDIFSVRNWHIVNGDFKALLKPMMDGQATIDLGAQKDFPQLSQLTANPNDAKIRPDCLTGECTDPNGNKRVAGIVRFEGRWRTRPLLRCERAWILPAAFQDMSRSDFRRLSDLNTPRIGETQRPLATALALETEIERLEDLYFEINGVDQRLHQLSDKRVCQAWLGSSVSSCVVLELENWPNVTVDPTCNVDNPPAHCRVDRHFAMFYDLIMTPPREDQRWLPYVAAGSVKCPNARGPGNPPGIRCPPTF